MKNRSDETARVFGQVQVWFRRSLGLSGGKGRRCVQVEEGNGPTWRPIIRQGCKGETARCQSMEEEPRDGSDQTILFQEVLSFLEVCAQA